MNSPTLITNRLLPSNHIRSICQGLFFLFFSFKKFKNNNRSTKFMKFSNQIIKQFNYFLFFKIINGFLYSDSSPRKIANSNLLRINWIEALLARIEISTRFWLHFYRLNKLSNSQKWYILGKPYFFFPTMITILSNIYLMPPTYDCKADNFLINIGTSPLGRRFNFPMFCSTLKSLNL